MATIPTIPTTPTTLQQAQPTLDALGARLLTTKPRGKRVVWLVKGAAKTGKSHLAFDAPGALSYMNIDRGEEGVVERFVEGDETADGKQIWNFDVNMTRDMISNLSDEITKAKCEPLLQAAMRFYDASVLGHAGRAASIRSVIIDTWSEFFSLGCFARIGKDKQFMPEQRTKINGIFSSMIHDAMYGDKNVILIAKITEWDGVIKAVGYNQTEGLVQTVIMTGKRIVKIKGGGQETVNTYTITDCRTNRDVEGETFTSEDLGEHPFAKLAAIVTPGTKASDWR